MPEAWPGGDSDGGGDEQPSGAPLPPEDRLWRHPSELWAASALPAPAPAATAGAIGGRRLWGVAVVAAVAGATLALGIVALLDAPPAEVATTGSPPARFTRTAPDDAVHEDASAWLGIEGSTLTDSVSMLVGRVEADAVRIERVLAESPAGSAGLVEGDVLTRVNGRRIDSMEDLLSTLRRQRPGDVAAIVLLRDGVEVRVTVVLGNRDG